MDLTSTAATITSADSGVYSAAALEASNTTINTVATAATSASSLPSNYMVRVGLAHGGQLLTEYQVSSVTHLDMGRLTRLLSSEEGLQFVSR